MIQPNADNMATEDDSFQKEMQVAMKGAFGREIFLQNSNDLRRKSTMDSGVHSTRKCLSFLELSHAERLQAFRHKSLSTLLSG